MSYLVDTNVLSELRRKAPDRNVVEWFSARPGVTLYVSVLTLGEIRKGIEAHTDEIKRQRLADWLETELTSFFSGRILTIDPQVADRWGRMMAEAGRPLPSVDSLLAATAAAHDLVMVTRNSKDFEGLPVQTFNPWSGSSAS